jgi:hypothetical protein
VKISPRIGLSGFFTPLLSHQWVLLGDRDTWECIRGFDVPAAQVELGHSYESLHWIFNMGEGQHCLGMRHETASTVSMSDFAMSLSTGHGLCYALEHRPRFENEGGKRYAA